jgi:preprotein translocase subunit SecA
MSFLQKIFGSSNQRALKKMQVHVDQINLLEAEYQSMEDAGLFALKDKLAKKLCRRSKQSDSSCICGNSRSKRQNFRLTPF